MIAGAPEARSRRCAPTATRSGVSFQIADDLLDYGGLSAALGKNTGDDFRERKMTLPVIRALAAADAGEREFWARVIGKGEQRAGRPRRGAAADAPARGAGEHPRHGAGACRAGAGGAGAAAGERLQGPSGGAVGLRGGADRLSVPGGCNTVARCTRATTLSP